jgi:hypothetical protein
MNFLTKLGIFVLPVILVACGAVPNGTATTAAKVEESTVVDTVNSSQVTFPPEGSDIKVAVNEHDSSEIEVGVVDYAVLQAATSDDSGFSPIGGIAFSSDSSISILNWSSDEVVDVSLEGEVQTTHKLSGSRYTNILSSESLDGVFVIDNGNECSLLHLKTGNKTPLPSALCSLPIGLEMYVDDEGWLFIRDLIETTFTSTGINVLGITRSQAPANYLDFQLRVDGQRLMLKLPDRDNEIELSFNEALISSLSGITPMGDEAIVAIAEVENSSGIFTQGILFITENAAHFVPVSGNNLYESAMPLSVWGTHVAVATATTEGLLLNVIDVADW